MESLLDRPHWLFAGLLLGGAVVAVSAALNERLGVSGGYAAVFARRFTWKAWFLFGIALGGAAFALLAGRWRTGDGYGWLGDQAGAATPIVLLAAGVLIGFGARTAGGCTSGHGLSGAAFGARSSIVATCVFFAMAIATAFAVRAVLG